MTVYVDDMRRPARVGRLNARWSHLTADTKAELHDFATVKLGLDRRWFQEPAIPGLWHYDVTDRVRDQAIALGAEAVSYFDDHERIYWKEGREP
jgi:hypothetical protein